MKLSRRLERIASFVEAGNRVADVGTDHGYIPISLVEAGLAPSALAMDVREGPLARARDHIRAAGLSEKIETRLSDGVEGLAPGEADTVVIAGMGGELVIHILDRGRRLWDRVAQWVLSPQSEVSQVRRYLLENGFFIAKEEMVKEDGKFYTMIDARRAAEGQREERLTEAQYLYGPLLIRGGSSVFREYLEEEERKRLSLRERLCERGTEGAFARLAELKRELEYIEEARDEMQRNHRGAEPAGPGAYGSELG